jgi:hypothetical protein
MIKIGQIYRQNCHNRLHKVEMTLNRSNIQSNQAEEVTEGLNDIE